MAAFTGRVAVDLVNVFDRAKGKGARVLTTLAWGDSVRVLGKSSGTLKVQLELLATGGSATRLEKEVGFIRPPSKSSGFSLDDLVTKQKQDPGVMKLDFVDVQQGDAAILWLDQYMGENWLWTSTFDDTLHSIQSVEELLAYLTFNLRRPGAFTV